MMDYYFKAEHLCVGYSKQPLIEKIDIGLQKGEIMTLIGPNGAGKSTILKSIARQLSPISGTIYLDNNRTEDMTGAELSQNVAVVLTDKLRTEMMTCEDVVATGRYPYTGMFGILSDSDRRIVKEAMDLVQVSAIRDQDFRRISDGQRQRVMLARAICQEPELIILDEPTSFLDVKYKLEFLSILQRMRREKKWTIIMSLHELELAEKVSDKILCINGKYVDRFGSPEEIFEPGYISQLFDISTGSYDEVNGSMELAAVKEPASVFVIAGGGSGRRVYRRLQRSGIAFAAGILCENDCDYPVAKALASDLIAATAFEPIPDETLEMAKRRLDTCDRVICCKESFGTYEQANRALLDYAKLRDKQVEMLLSK